SAALQRSRAPTSPCTSPCRRARRPAAPARRPGGRPRGSCTSAGRSRGRSGGRSLCCELPGSGWASTGSTRASCDEAPSSDASADRPEPARRQLALEFDSIGAQLKMLEEEEDPGRVLVARRCHALGFESEQLLVNHCSQFGRVSRVLVMHSRVKQKHKPTGPVRLRPGSIGFIVMAEAEGAERVLQAGAEQTVAGRRLEVGPFRRPSPQQRAAGHRSAERRQWGADSSVFGVPPAGHTSAHSPREACGFPRRLAPTILRV
ncbi:unnamed protein product, partial [Prorocentrum cordatum]